MTFLVYPFALVSLAGHVKQLDTQQAGKKKY